ncbi:MAG TPA: outer membrane protein assembly factor BamD [Gemmatimonadaceae bacterium]|nr:outer membrane protein assembly factor BamD [Gemmatimonadaceae bacterium]
MHPPRWIVAACLAAGVSAGCAAGFQVRRFPTSDALYTASLAEFRKGKWDNAVTGFEKLTLDLSARDTLLPLSYWYLAQAHDHRAEHILASTTFARIAQSFPDDSLADDALLASGDSYLAVWRRPDLDPQYGTLAQIQYRQLLSTYPDSPLADRARQGLLRIDEDFAAKEYLNGQFYVKRGAFDSAIIYFKSIVKEYPNTDHARMALLRMVEVYRRPQLNYKEEAAETCNTLRTAYPTDPEVKATCPAAVAADSSAAAAKRPAADSARRTPPR